MLLNPILLTSALQTLDTILSASLHGPIEIRVCGGGALIIMGSSGRETRDVDVILPPLPEAFLRAAQQVAQELNLAPGWINNGPASLVRELEQGWESRCTLIYEGKVLRILALGRRDFIATKLFAFCDRDEADLEDLLVLKPSEEDLNGLLNWVLDRDGSEYWPERVHKRFQKLRRRLGYES